MKLKCDEPHSNVAFNFNLRHYNKANREIRKNIEHPTNVHRKIAVDMDAVPFELKRTLGRWIELDAALYLVANAQKRTAEVKKQTMSSEAVAAAAAAAAVPG